VDIVLETRAENPSLALREFKRFADGSGYSTTLAVRSGWISAEYDFFFEQPRLVAFIQALEEIDRTLVGSAKLKPVYEEQFIAFHGNGMGHIGVQGDLVEHGGIEQRVRFAFRTDQTCLGPFIRALRQAS